MAERKDIHTISMLVANKPGVLVRVALVFARRGFNIDSLVVSPAFDSRFSRMTITAQGNPAILLPIINQLNKLIDVIHAYEHTGIDAVHTELALTKIKCTAANKPALHKLLKKLRARVLDETDNSIILEMVGNTAKLDEFEAILQKYNIIEMVRTGKVVMVKGQEQT